MKKIFFFLSIAAFSNNIFNLHSMKKVSIPNLNTNDENKSELEDKFGQKNGLAANTLSFSNNKIIDEEPSSDKKPLKKRRTRKERFAEKIAANKNDNLLFSFGVPEVKEDDGIENNQEESKLENIFGQGDDFAADALSSSSEEITDKKPSSDKKPLKERRTREKRNAEKIAANKNNNRENNLLFFFEVPVVEGDDEIKKQKEEHKKLLEKAKKEKEVELEKRKQQIQQRRVEDRRKIQEAKNLLQERNKAKAEEVKKELYEIKRRQIRENFLEKQDKIFSSKKK